MAYLLVEAPCARCGKPTLRGLNSDFCTLTCEDLWHAEYPGHPPEERDEDEFGEDPGSPFVSERS